MNRNIRHSAVALACALVVVACGGGGGEPAPAPTPIAAVADNYTVDWSGPRRLSVLDNDGDTAGATVSIARNPRAGQATVDGNAVVYAPAAGFIGEDTLIYRVTRDGVSSTAEIQLTVEGNLTLEGQIGDTPLPGARVTATIGDRSTAVDADAQGRFVLNVKTTRPEDLVRLSAAGTGAQSRIVLEGFVGDARRLGYSAVAGKVGIAQWPALRINALSSAGVGLVAQRGPMPTNGWSLFEAQNRIAALELVDAAALLKLVIEQKLPLPAGAITTAELMHDAALYRSFHQQQLADKRAELEAVRVGMADDASLLVAPPKPDAPSVAYLYGDVLGRSAVSRVTLDADGKAQVLDGSGSHPGRWRHDGKTLSVSFDTPLRTTREEYGAGPDPWIVTRHQTGFEIRELAGAGLVPALSLQHWIGYEIDGVGGPRPGVQRPVETGWQPLSRRPHPDASQALPESDFVPGKRWAGLHSATALGSDGYRTLGEDVLLITGAKTGRMERTGVNVSWNLEGGILDVVLPDVTHRYTRTGKDGSGADRWLAEERRGGKLVGLTEVLVVEADARSPIAAVPAAGVWEVTSAAGYDRGRRQFGFRQDRHAAVGGYQYDVAEGFHRSLDYVWGWRQVGDDRLVLERFGDPRPECFQAPVPPPACQPVGTRELRIVARRGDTVFAIENFGAYHRLITLTERGLAQ